MTTEARDLIEVGAHGCHEQNQQEHQIAILAGGFDHLDPGMLKDYDSLPEASRAMLRRVQRVALIATFKKLAEDGPTEAMVEAAAKVHREDSCEDDESLALAMLSAGLAAIGRELEDLTP